MEEYFKLVSEELLNKLNQTRQFVKKHNPTIGLLTEEILRSFLKKYLPNSISVEQGFIISQNGKMSKQCDILIYDSNNYAPFYRINDIVIVPSESVIAVIEVKTSINKQIFHSVVDYFSNIGSITNAKKHLFIYNSCEISKIKDYLHSYKHKGDYKHFDHDTFELLPDEITGINQSYNLKRDYVISNRDSMGYSSYFYKKEKGMEISALQIFYLSVYSSVIEYISNFQKTENPNKYVDKFYEDNRLSNYFAIELFTM